MKFVGKGFGTLAVACNSLRNATWASVCEPPMETWDRTIRFADALAAAEGVKKHVITQLYVEKDLEARRARVQEGRLATPPVASVAAFAGSLSALENACRRFLDYVGVRSSAQEAVEAGLYKAMPGVQHRLRSVRESAFTSGKADAELYGGRASYRDYRLAGKWRELVEYLHEKGLLMLDAEDDNRCLLLHGSQLSVCAIELVRTWRLQPATLSWLGVPSMLS